jgi:putative membrane protein
MKIAGEIIIAFVILEHLYILWLEMFAWETQGKRVFKGAMPVELFRPTKRMAANQGLYNGFLAAGLTWSLMIEDDFWKQNVAIFFLSCVIIAGCYGAYSVSRKIFIVQALPAIIALILLLAEAQF